MMMFSASRMVCNAVSISLMVCKDDSKSVVTLAATTASESRSACKASYFEVLTMQEVKATANNPITDKL